MLSGAFIFPYFLDSQIVLSENAIHAKNAFVNFKISIQDISYVEKSRKTRIKHQHLEREGFWYFGYLMEMMFGT